MDMYIKDKLKSANLNIEELIDIIMNLEKEQKNGYCCTHNIQSKGCNGECDKCKETHYDLRKKELLNKYYIES